MNSAKLNISTLLTNTDSLLNHLFYFEVNVEKPDGKSRRGVSVNYVDLKEKKSDFLRELRNTICAWVYGKEKYRALFDAELNKRSGDFQNAAAQIEALAKEKFRRSAKQGQFGELLLFNLLQVFFEAVPVMRKMRITTNPEIERNGADAIHYKPIGAGGHLFYLGEAKSYTSKYSFNKAIEDAVESVLSTHDRIHDEMGLYVSDDFIEPELQDVAEGFKDGKLQDVRVELVCVVTYHETKVVSGLDEVAIKKAIKAVVEERCGGANPTVPASLVERMHYIVFPIWNFDQMLAEMQE